MGFLTRYCLDVGMPVILQKPAEASQYNGTALEQTKIDRKLHANDGGSSYQIEDGVKGSNTIFGAKGESNKPREGFPSEFQAIKPGIAADLKFGGCEEFVQHAGEDQTNPDSGSGLASLSGNNPAASAQS
ncbi:hypothetical protein Acr_00g0073100 [Actinidia rufa]|uniref:Uncharacterized protein n=1 Tax=Actinidia rufa TaxID=165716 RepID=A0A7J0DS07_9ERIC|nr:hypothetical protein Acr_00g0073100 [Actinidia rufa]